MVFSQRNSALTLIQDRTDEGAGGMHFPPWNLSTIAIDLIPCRPTFGYRDENHIFQKTPVSHQELALILSPPGLGRASIQITSSGSGLVEGHVTAGAAESKEHLLHSKINHVPLAKSPSVHHTQFNRYSISSPFLLDSLVVTRSFSPKPTSFRLLGEFPSQLYQQQPLSDIFI